MDIDTYLWKNRMTLRDFAKKLNVSEVALGRIKRRKSSPSLRLAYKIVEFSKGEIEYSQLLADCVREEIIKDLNQ